jgi:hypothetical protein
MSDINQYRRENCNHGVVYNSEEAAGRSSYEVREKFPRLSGYCPLGCGYYGVYYASFEHYVMGDW